VSGLRRSIALSLRPLVPVCLIPLLLSAQVPGSIDIDPRLSWYTVESDHFDVHFSCRGRPDSAHVGLAREVAAIAEDIHAAITPALGWTPRARTQIVVADFYDYSNGWAAPFPNNVITIIPTPPAGSKTNEGDWLRTLILHEYSHILQIDQVEGVPAALRKVFGRVAMPNALAPAWLNEGYAVYNETRFSQFGRLRSAEYDMMARAAADSEKLLPIDRCGNYELQRFPGGDAPYLYGSLLCGHVAAATDPGVWDRYNRRRSAGIPFLENFYARPTLGRSIYRAWNETRDGLIAEAKRTAALVQEKPLTQFRQVTHEGFSTGSPLWSRYGTRLYYVSQTGREYPAIKMVVTATGQTYVLHRGLVTGNLSLSPDGRQLAFAELNRTGNYYEYTEISALDVQTGSVRRLTHGERARDPDFAPDESLLVFVSNGGGENDLKLLDLRTGKVSRLTDTEDHTGYHCPRFSPGGRWIAVGVNSPGGYADIELVDRHTGWTIPVTHDRANDLSPTWSGTGKLLFFVSDRTGVYNLYAYQLATGKTFQVTNAQYGVFEPAISPDNRRIAVTSFSASGYDISVTDLSSADWRPAPEFNDTLLAAMNVEREATNGEHQLYHYSPFPTVVPAFWLPWAALSDEIQLQELGAFTMGWDALEFHQYQLAAGYRFNRSSPFLTAAYTLRRYRALVSAAADLDLHRQRGSVNVEVPFLQTRHSSWLDLDLTAAHDSATNVRADLDWTYSNAFQYRFCVAPVQGRAIGLHTDVRRGLYPNGDCPRSSSEQDLTRVLGYWFEYLGRPPREWSLRTKLVLGTAFEEAADAYGLDNGPGLLGVRGYLAESEPARSVVAAGLQFRVPLWWVERGIGTGPLFLENVNAAVFADAGITTDWPSTTTCKLQTANLRLGVGAEIRTDLILSHLLPVSVYAGCGFGVNPLWTYRPYFGVSSSVLEGILGSRRQGLRTED